MSLSKLFAALLIITHFQSAHAAILLNPEDEADPWVEATEEPSRDVASVSGASYRHAPPKHLKHPSYFNVSVAYMSWNETMTLQSATQLENATANFYGTGLIAEEEYYFSQRWGFCVQGFIAAGLANFGGTQNTLIFTSAERPWWGVGLSPRLTYRLYKPITASLGVLGVYRNVDIGNSNDTITVASGSDSNFAPTLDLRTRLTPSIELRQEVGVLMIQASLFWSLGIGYKF